MRPPSPSSLWETFGTQSGKEPKPPISCQISLGGAATSTVTFVDDTRASLFVIDWQRSFRGDKFLHSQLLPELVWHPGLPSRLVFRNALRFACTGNDRGGCRMSK